MTEDRRQEAVNHPSHYNEGSILERETIDSMKGLAATNDEYRGMLKGNVIKYISRYRLKNRAVEDLKKARWYLDELIKFEEELVAKQNQPQQRVQ